MKKLLILLITCLSGPWLIAQSDITGLEYYIDDDPGVGMATSIPVTQDAEIDVNFTVPVSGMGLPQGIHTLVVRSQNLDGEWSFVEKRIFYIQDNAGAPSPVVEDVSALEYFIDEDPGVGLGTLVSVTPGSEVDINQLLDIGTLPDGFHLIGFRAKNADNKWSFTEKRTFYIQDIVGTTPSLSNISSLEYFIDEDPGVGLANPVGISTGAMIDIDQLISTAGLDQGFHLIGVRSKNENEKWGFAEIKRFYIQQEAGANPIVSAITKLEYFIDEDPGLGLGIEIPISPAAEVVDILSLAVSTGGNLSIGDHSITIRAQNDEGRWGHKETVTFTVDGDCPIVAFDVEMACVGEPIQLIDTSTGILGDATYSWYADGQLISNTESNIEHQFDSPGVHSFSLAIQNGNVCTDSIGVNIEIKAKPVVVFYADPVDLGQPTTYIVDEFNLDPSSTWEWDFDSDGTADDATQGNTSFTFSTAGTYLTSLVVTDGQGCGASFSRSVTVEAIETTSITAVFQSTIACEGAPTLFNDLSINVPPDATYAWDFDGDGMPDDTNKGSVSFTYESVGTYTARLVITTADANTYSYDSNIEVVAIPIAEFSATAICAGEPTVFTDSSSNTDNATYSWDFNGDGMTDEITVGDVAFTYAEPGNYTASLLVENEGGCFDFKAINIQIENEVEANFNWAYEISETSAIVQFENLSQEGNTYSWDFGDGNNSSALNPSHAFENADGQTFSVCLTVTNDCSFNEICETLTFEFPEPTLGISPSDAGILVYPNPSDGTFFLDFKDAKKKDYDISIYDLSGRLMINSKHLTSDSYEIVTKTLSIGSYLLIIKSEDQRMQQKLFVR